MSTKITHLTSAHLRYDTRIFIKMCSSLAKKEHYNVSLVVADGKGNENKKGVTIVDVGAKSGVRLSRMTQTVKKVFKKAVELDSDIYHLHDPELIPAGLKLKNLGKKVIFDAHEDLPKQILGKPYLNILSKNILAFGSLLFEKYTLKKFDYIITATPYIRDKFLKINANSIDINNYPIIEELATKIPWNNRKNQVCYVGVIAKIRGNLENVQAMKFVNQNITFKLAGTCYETQFLEELKSNEGWSRVEFIGALNRNEVKMLLQESKIGLVTLHPTINYIDALPVKMFEYMLAGIPVIASQFEILQEIIEKEKCGICVNPLEAKEIAEAINYLIEQDEEGKKMGENGKNAVIKKYNWTIEEKKLFEVYESII